MDSRVLRVLAAAPLALVLSACDVHLGNLAGRAGSRTLRQIRDDGVVQRGARGLNSIATATRMHAIREKHDV